MTFDQNVKAHLRVTLRSWPVIAGLTMFLCFLTKTAAGWIGIDLPDQMNVEIVKKWMLHAFDSSRTFLTVSFLLAQVVLIMPILEELFFRGLLVKFPVYLCKRHAERKRGPQRDGAHVTSARKPLVAFAFFSIFSSSLFSAAHYIQQPWPDAAFIALFFFGVAQCVLYLKTEHIWCPMLNHILFNLTNLVLLFIVPAN